MVAALSRRSGLRSQSATTFAPGCAKTLVRSAPPRFPVPITPAPIDLSDVWACANVTADPIRKCLRFIVFILITPLLWIEFHALRFPETPGRGVRAHPHLPRPWGAPRSARRYSRKPAAYR